MTTLSEALAPRSDQLNSDDLIPGPRVLKITGGRIARDGRQTKIILSYEGDAGKPFKPCKTMGRAMVLVWGLTDEGFEEQVKGKSIRVYRDPEVTFGDQGQVGGIRISHMSHIDKPTQAKLTVSQGKKAVFVFHPLLTEQPTPADFTLTHARLAIAKADSLPDLERVWKQRSMAPYRDELKEALDARKAELTPNDGTLSETNPTAAEGRPDSERGEQQFNDDGTPFLG